MSRAKDEAHCLFTQSSGRKDAQKLAAAMRVNEWAPPVRVSPTKFYAQDIDAGEQEMEKECSTGQQSSRQMSFMEKIQQMQSKFKNAEMV